VRFDVVREFIAERPHEASAMNSAAEVYTRRRDPVEAARAQLSAARPRDPLRDREVVIIA